MKKSTSHIWALSLRSGLLTLLVLVVMLSAAAGVCASENGVPVTFNDGWRWDYRARVVEMLKPDVYNASATREDVFRAELGLASSGKEGLARDADSLFATLTHNGEASRAAVLEALITFYDSTDTGALEASLRLHPSTGYAPLAWYLLGDHYERKGFYPEAEGYYNRLYKEAPEGPARTAGLFQLSRIRYFKGEYESAKGLFKEAVQAGSPEAPVWLANTLLIKGEFASARAIYETARVNIEGADPLTLLSMGDMAVINGEYDKARSLFSLLRSRYAFDQFLAPFFDLKIGDAYSAEGRLSEGIEIYRKTKENLNMLEGWAMASLSIADIYAAGASNEELMAAYDLYATVAAGNYVGSEQAHISMARTALKAGQFAMALADAKGFPAGYPSSRLKMEMEDVVGELVVRWMAALAAEKDYYGVVKLYMDYGYSVPFGKKADTYLMAGKAYAALGLDSDAAAALDSAIKIARDETEEEAMVTLVGVYISQKDWSGAERLVTAFKARYPNSDFMPQAERVLHRAAFIKKDYKTAASFKIDPADGEGLMIKAAASVKMGDLDGAIKLYRLATGALDDGALKSLAQAYAGIADASFSLGRYAKAVEAYRWVLDKTGPDDKRERAWALYRLAQSYEALGNDAERKAALEELGAMKGELGGWAEMIFKQEARM